MPVISKRQTIMSEAVGFATVEAVHTPGESFTIITRDLLGVTVDPFGPHDWTLALDRFEAQLAMLKRTQGGINSEVPQ